MAIKKDLSSSKFGVAFPGAYFRIATIQIGRARDAANRHVVMIDVPAYASQIPDEDTQEIEFRRYYAPVAQVEARPGANFIAKCYSWLMVQPDMAGGTEV